MRTTEAWIRWSLAGLVLCGGARFVRGQTAEPIPVLIVSGMNNHDWPWTSESLKSMLSQTGRFKVEVTTEPSKVLGDKTQLARYRAIVLDYNNNDSGKRWGEPAESNFLAAVKAGTGVAVIHAANNAYRDFPWPEYEKLVGDLWREGTGHGAFHAFDVKIVDATHPITAGLGDLKAHPDELYHNLVRTPGTDYKVLATAFSSKESGGTGEDEPMIFVGNYGAGRVFHTPLGHVWPNTPATRASQQDPQFQRLIARGVEWAATGKVTDLPLATAASLGRLQNAAAGGRTPTTGAWKVLFDGKSTDAWRGYGQKEMPAKGWKVVGDALVCEKGGTGGDLVTKEEFGDFELEFEWRVTPKANSGVMYRVVELDAPSWNSGPEYQVLDDAYFDGPVDHMHSAAALYDLQPAGDVQPAKAGEWNQARIVVQGSRVAHFLNGKLALVFDFSGSDGKASVQKSKFAQMADFMKHERGRIALQDHGDEVAYRNLRIRSIEPESIALFNGKDLSGWKWISPEGVDVAKVWSVASDGSLTCTGTPAGYIRTEADYTNYVLDLDWRWNPSAGGNRNSGVLLRVIEEDKVWPKSLEAQLQDGSAGDFWKIDEFPATTAPERTNGRNAKKIVGAEKPLGEWNHYTIRVEHGHVTLEVNGQLVNEASAVLETPGKIALQSEGAEIHFKDVRLTPLP